MISLKSTLIFRRLLNFDLLVQDSLQRMIGQQKISSFFSPSQKRSSASSESSSTKRSKIDETAVENTPPKPSKTEETNEVLKETNVQKDSHEKLTLSPEQKQKIDQNRFQALAKLHQKQTNGLLVCVGESWLNALEEEFKKPYFIQLGNFVAGERKSKTVYPPAENVFTWTRACTVQEVKVIILGQDPYHGPNQAHGLSFSVQPGVPPPPSLVNMYKELEKDIEGFQRPDHGYLMGWAKQGVLMLNAVLTVRSHQANSHKDKGWERLTDAVVAYFNKNRQGIVFILWGAYAQKKGAQIDKKKHHVIKGVHPSPLSAHKGYFGCKHFSKCNEYLTQHGKKPIDWCDLPKN